MKFYFLPPLPIWGITVEKINHPSFQRQCFFHFQKLMTPLLLHPLPNSFDDPGWKAFKVTPFRKKPIGRDIRKVSKWFKNIYTHHTIPRKNQQLRISFPKSTISKIKIHRKIEFNRKKINNGWFFLRGIVWWV